MVPLVGAEDGDDRGFSIGQNYLCDTAGHQFPDGGLFVDTDDDVLGVGIVGHPKNRIGNSPRWGLSTALTFLGNGHGIRVVDAVGVGY